MTYFRGRCIAHAWALGDQKCPNETEDEWLYKNSAGINVAADGGLTVKCIEEAGIPDLEKKFFSFNLAMWFYHMPI